VPRLFWQKTGRGGKQNAACGDRLQQIKKRRGFPSHLWCGVVGAVKQVIDAHAVEIGKLDEHLGGERDYSRFILRVCVLRNIEQFSKLPLL